MRKNPTFIEYNKKSCIRNNLMSLIIFVSIMILSYFSFDLSDSIYKSNPSNGMSNLVVLVLLLYLSIVLLIITTIVTPLFMKIYKEFTNNLKSFITLWTCSILISISLFNLFQSYMFSMIYLLATILGSLASLTFKWHKTNKNTLIYN